MRVGLILLIAMIVIAAIPYPSNQNTFYLAEDPLIFQDQIEIEPFGNYSLDINTTMEKRGLYGEIDPSENVSLIICPKWELQEILNRTSFSVWFERDYISPDAWSYIIGWIDENATFSIALRNNVDRLVTVNLSVFEDTSAPVVTITQKIYTLFPITYEVTIHVEDRSRFEYWIFLNQNYTFPNSFLNSTFSDYYTIPSNRSSPRFISWKAIDYVGNEDEGIYELQDHSLRQTIVGLSIVLLVCVVVLVEVRISLLPRKNTTSLPFRRK